MDKIKELMRQAGLKEEIVSGICDALNEYVETKTAALQSEYAEKVGKAKKICLEETEAHKRDLSRRVQIFLESRTATIEKKIAAQTAVKESATVAKLEKIRALVEGVELNGPANGELRSEVKKLQAQVAGLTTENKKVRETAQRHAQIAEGALKRTRALEARNRQLTLNESRQTTTTQQTTKNRRLDEGRTRGQGVTTRRTLVENQVRQPARQTTQPSSMSGYTPDQIADQMTDL